MSTVRLPTSVPVHSGPASLFSTMETKGYSSAGVDSIDSEDTYWAAAGRALHMAGGSGGGWACQPCAGGSRVPTAAGSPDCGFYAHLLAMARRLAANRAKQPGRDMWMAAGICSRHGS